MTPEAGPLFDDAFPYPNGPLQGNGTWTQPNPLDDDFMVIAPGDVAVTGPAGTYNVLTNGAIAGNINAPFTVTIEYEYAGSPDLLVNVIDTTGADIGVGVLGGADLALSVLGGFVDTPYTPSAGTHTLTIAFDGTNVSLQNDADPPISDVKGGPWTGIALFVNFYVIWSNLGDAVHIHRVTVTQP